MSRYDDLPIAERIGADGRPLRHLRRRLVAARDAPDAPVAAHRVSAGDRLDLLAARHLGDPRLAWQIADANAALDPAELAVIGRTILIPQGPPRSDP